MGFSKKDRATEITIGVKHSYYPDTVFYFTFPKRLPQTALDQESKFIGLKDDEIPDELRKQLIALVSEMITGVTGFDDFPTDERPLAERAKEYFDSPEDPELETIISSVWTAYKVAAMPQTFLESRENHSAATHLSSQAAE